jgi:tRNA A37 methylthiotransferase MiaB
MLVAFYTFGCTQNNYETQMMRKLFNDNGDVVIEEGEPGVIIINSCAVTTFAEKGAEELAARLRKKYPNAILALVGCYGEIFIKNGAQFKYADIVLGNDKYGIVDVIKKYWSKPGSRASDRARSGDNGGGTGGDTDGGTYGDTDGDTYSGTYGDAYGGTYGDAYGDTYGDAVINSAYADGAARRSERYKPYADTARAFLHVQNGCDCHCAYCVVPSLRGKSVSKPLDSVIDRKSVV